MRPVTVNLGPGAATNATSAMANLDEWADAPLGVQLVVTAGTATVQHSMDNPCDLVNPVPVGSMVWDTSLVPAGAIGATGTISFSIATAPLWMRILAATGPATARMTLVQYNVVEP
jgi:hypothetical protein